MAGIDALGLTFVDLMKTHQINCRSRSSHPGYSALEENSKKSVSHQPSMVWTQPKVKALSLFEDLKKKAEEEKQVGAAKVMFKANHGWFERFQSMDQGIFATFKAYCLKLVMRYFVSASDGEDKPTIKQLWKNYNIKMAIENQDERAAELSREQNEKTIRSTQTALRNFREFLISKYPSETREIYVIPCTELDAYLASFFVDARQKDGSEYEPNSLANYQCGLERYLKEHRYGYSITRDKEFKRSQEALKQKQIELRCKGKGNKPHKSMKLTFADELILRKRGLLSRYNPEGLLNLVWLNNTKAFGHCTGFHGSTLKWGDIRLRVTETGLEYLEWMGQETGDMNAKTKRGGTDSRVYATQHAPQTCPVQDYKEYAQRRPPAMRYEDAPFYLSIKPVVNLAALHWYNCQALGKNKLAKMVKTMCEKGNIPGRKTNFSVYQSCSTLSEAQSNQLVLICNNLSQQAAQSMASHSSSGNFIVSASYDSSSDTA
ncbi:uncharacterized protein KIAA1958-like [Carettochelys insculpta]|uniref:uncharacterized protein KIAA1958-like n=1 Tax=Carettochelys insculpta TaxID=44489 RepID=UPI003EBCAC5F